MQVLQTIADFRAARRAIQGSLGLAPTMGYLHDGHLALVRCARQDNDTVVASIFVNPTQFGPSEDFESYPRDPDRDLAMLDKEGVDLVFAPRPEEMYPSAFDTWVEVGALGQRLEGASRPGHFKGVATVVAKLFNMVRPDRAYFGQKDGQQLRVIRKMVLDLDMGIEVVGVPTVREPDGLALSSRNAYLSPAEREAAVCLWRSLSRARGLWTAGELDAGVIRQTVASVIGSESLARVDYISVACADTLEELTVIDRPALLSLAVWIGKTRLIDNIDLDG